MSLEAQEGVLLELLFDDALRERFGRDGAAALEGRGLDAAELDDFAAVRVDALELDAGLRRSMVLSQLCVAYPISFAIVAAAPDGLERLRRLVDVRTMRTPGIERAVVFGRRLRGQIDAAAGDLLRAGLRAVLEAELAMAWTAASVLRETLDLGRAPASAALAGDDWEDVPVRVAPFVSATLLPAPLDELRATLCPVSERELWRHLSRAPTPEADVIGVLAASAPRLLVARAAIDRPSRCDPTVRHVTVELSEGFATLLGHAQGEYSVRAMLDGLEGSGATPELLASVRGGFLELGRAGMLEAAA